MQDFLHTITYAKIGARRLRQSERHINLLAGSSLLNFKKADANRKAAARKAMQKKVREIISGYVGDVAFLLPTPFELPAPCKKPEPAPRRMSPRTKRKIREKSQAFIRTYGIQSCTFLTLTFINKIDDKEATQLLNKFLTVLRHRYGRFSYLWVAERQDGKRNSFAHCTGNVHFHILVNRRFPVVAINALWVRQQYRHGLTHPKAQASQILAANDKEVQALLNPVDIDSIRDESACTGYLVKYMAKSDDEFLCQVWNCSKEVSALATGIVLSKRQYENNADRLSNSVVTKHGELIEAKRTCVYDRENRLVAVTSPVLNVRYFNRKYLKEVQLINQIIIKHLADFQSGRKSLQPYRVPKEHYLATININCT